MGDGVIDLALCVCAAHVFQSMHKLRGSTFRTLTPSLTHQLKVPATQCNQYNDSETKNTQTLACIHITQPGRCQHKSRQVSAGVTKIFGR